MSGRRRESELADEFLCPICYQQYGNMRIPKTLPCGHTFCHCCLKQLLDAIQRIACSVCNAKHLVRSLEELKPNYQTMNAAELAAKLANRRLSQPVDVNVQRAIQDETQVASPVKPSLQEARQEKKLTQLVILILGETGCGKSTLINALANYIRFNNLDEALAGELHSYIATKFFITVDNFEQKCITVGASENECFKTGQSATQKPQIYNFKTDKYTVDIIDTPGIGDVQGIEQDKENMNEVLAILARYKTVNGICLLMKSNEARLTTNVSYCLSELLLRLHREAAENICFFFTNSRGTFYQPGDSMATLKAYLEKVKEKNKVELALTKENVFCLDNEAYRLVCAIHQGATFSQEQRQNFAASWAHSNREILRFLDFAASRVPHETEKILSLNQARKIVLLMAKPMADIAQLNQDNIILSQRHLNDVEKTETEISELEKKIKIPQESFEVKALPYPRTVCTGSTCVETQRQANSNLLQTIYKQICHHHCYLKGVTRETVPEPALRNCQALRVGGMCNVCGCNWSLHMHITYTQKKVIKMVDDPAIANLLTEKLSAKELKEGILDHLSRRYQDMEYEQDYLHSPMHRIFCCFPQEERHSTL